MAVKNKIFFPTLISSVDYQPVRTLPHIYFYNGLKDCDEYFIQHYQSGSTSVVEASIQNQFPYLDYYDGLTPSTGSNSLLFFNETPPYGVTPTGSLYTQYWDKYVSLLYNPRTRLINASAIIPLADYFEMELNDIVQWRGNYYHLRAINDYNLKDGTCKIQLLGPIISDAVTATQFDCTFNFSSSFEAIVPTTTTTVSPTTSTTTVSPTTSTTTLEPTTSTTTVAGLKLFVIESTNNTAFPFNSASHDIVLNRFLATSFTKDGYEPGFSAVSASRVITGTSDINTFIGWSGFPAGTLEFTQSLYGDATLIGTNAQIVDTTATTGITFTPGTINYDLYDTIKSVNFINPVPTTSTTTVSPTTSTTTLEPTTSTTTLVPTTSTTLSPTTSTTLSPTTSTTQAPTTSTTTTSISRLVRFEYTSSISSSINVDASFNTDYYDSGSFTAGTVSSGSPILIEDTVNIPLTDTFLIRTELRNADDVTKPIWFNDRIDVYITDYYDSLPPVSSSYLGLGDENKIKTVYDLLGYYSSSQWNTLTRKVEIYESTNKDLILYDVSGSNGFSSYNDALSYITGSGSVAHTIGILPVSQSMMQKGWLRVPAFNTDYTTRYTASIDTRRFYVGEFNGNREIVRFEPDTYATSSDIWVQRLNNKTPFEAERETTNNYQFNGGWPTLCGGTGTSTVDMYYNQESGSLFSYQEAAGWWSSLSFVNANAYGTQPFKNNTLATSFVSGDTFVVRYTFDYDFFQGNLNWNNSHTKYAWIGVDSSIFTPPRIGTVLRCS